MALNAFGLEAMFLLRRGQLAVALAYVAFTMACCLAALWLGISVIGHPVKAAAREGEAPAEPFSRPCGPGSASPSQ